MQISFLAGLLEVLSAIFLFGPNNSDKKTYIQRLLPSAIQNNVFVLASINILLVILIILIFIVVVKKLNPGE